MHRLQQFVTGILLPAVDQADESRFSTHDRFTGVKKKWPEGDAWLAERRAEVIEAFLWLHLGVEIGAFPEPASREVYVTYLIPFFESLLTQDSYARGRREYVAHSAESEALVIALPRYARILVEMGMRGEIDIFEKEHAGLGKAKTRVQSLFQSLSLLYYSFVERWTVRQFTYEVNFANPVTWEEHWHTECTADEVREADVTNSGSPIALVLAGYLNFWGYGARFKEAFEGFEGNREVSYTHAFRLKERVSEIQSWRINLRSDDTSKRFDQIQDRISTELESEARDLNLNPAGLGLLKESMDSAFDLWRAPEPAPEPVPA